MERQTNKNNAKTHQKPLTELFKTNADLTSNSHMQRRVQSRIKSMQRS